MNKTEILDVVKYKIQQKIEKFTSIIDETRASSNDTKSSMGDKYETGREMLQQEINNLQRHLNETLIQQNKISKISAAPCSKVQNGALVKTNKGLFYISVSVGEIVVDGKKIMTVSEDSPLVKAMFGMKVDMHFTINTIQQVIEEII